MIQNYFKIAFRHIIRNKSYLLINVIGLGLAFACCIIAFVNYQFANQADSFHEKEDQIFHVTVSLAGQQWPNVDVAAPLMSMAVSELGGVKAGVRVGKKAIIVKTGATVFSEELAVAAPNFFEVFSFPIKIGTANALSNPSNVLLSEETASKYFGTENPIGQIITINPEQSGQKELIVGGVYETMPSNSSLKLDMLTHISYVESEAYRDTLSHWNTSFGATFLVLNNPEDAENITQSLNRFLPLESKIEYNRPVTKYHLDPMNSVFHKRWETQNNNTLTRLEHPLLPIVPAIIAFLILLTACLNFTNTTVSFSNKRLKEMWVRKAMGSKRSQ